MLLVVPPSVTRAPGASCVAVVSARLSTSRLAPGGDAETSSGPAPLGDELWESKQRPRALVVDDAPDVTEMLAILLQYAGYEVVMVYSGAQALDAARAEHFDVVVSDIGMPGMNGYEVAEAMRALPGYEATPLVAVTGFTMHEDRDRALRCGFDAFLAKPINPRDLINLVERLRS